MPSLSEFLSLLEQFITIPSVSDNTNGVKQAIRFVKSYFSNTQLTIRRFSHNTYPSLVISKTPMKNYRLIFNAHIDVVPAELELFTLRKEKDTIFGRGVFDMKTAGLIMMIIFKELSQKGQLPDDVALMIVTDEEIGGANGTQYLLEKEHITGNFFLAGEPTNLHICTKLKGLLHIKIIQKGKASHGSKPWEGRNANVELVHKLSTFLKKYATDKDTWQSTYNLSLLRGGQATNIVSDYAEAFLDIRRIDSESSQSILQNLRVYFPDTNFAIIRDHPAMITDERNPMVSILKELAQKHTGKLSQMIKETYSSDAKYYSEKGIPCVNFGPVGGGMHADTEWLDLTSLKPYYDILKDFILG